MSDSDGFDPRPRTAQRRKLGKGLGALLGEARREEAVVRLSPGLDMDEDDREADLASGLANLPVSAVEPHPKQPRRHFDETALNELAASIAERGVIQPIVVRRLSSDAYQIVAGERRWRAAQKAQLHEIPALIRDLDDRDVMALALIENLQREDLNPVEEARAYHRLSEQEQMTQAEIAALVEKSRSHVANIMRLLSLPDGVLDHVEAGRLDMGHARALVGSDRAEEIARQAVEKSLSVRDVERLAKRDRETPERKAGSAGSEGPAQDADIASVEKHLEELLGLPVQISTGSKAMSGSVTIKYRTLDHLDLICQRLSGGTI